MTEPLKTDERAMLTGSLKCAVAFWAVFPTYGNGRDESSIELARVREYFAEARALADQDGGRLWGVSLAGPLVFVEPKTRQLVADRADAEGRLKPQDGVFVGTLPADETYAATAKKWAGVEWAMFLWPLPEDVRERRRLLAHESWHRVQEQIGLPGAMSPNVHLDTADCRVWLQLEWRALATALQRSGEERRQAIADALTFRAYRRALFPSAAGEERTMEMHEGLAEYTGVRLSSESAAEQRELALKNHSMAKDWPTFVFSFAYVSGPSYGLLLDELKPDWRKGLTPRHDLGDLLSEALVLGLPADVKAAALVRAAAYEGAQLVAAEADRDREVRGRISRERRRLVEGPVLRVPIQAMQFQFDPCDVHPLDDLGKVYPKMRMTDAWGVLEVTGGALIASDWAYVTVPAPAEPNARPLKGDGWALDLKERWKVAPGTRAGDYTLRRTEPD